MNQAVDFHREIQMLFLRRARNSHCAWTAFFIRQSSHEKKYIKNKRRILTPQILTIQNLPFPCLILRPIVSKGSNVQIFFQKRKDDAEGGVTSMKGFTNSF